LLTGEWRKFLC